MSEGKPTKGDSRGVFYDLFEEEEAAELVMRAQIVNALQAWLAESQDNQVVLSKRLGVHKSRVSEVKHGKVEKFSLDNLVRLAQRAGLKPTLRIGV
ncbi:XRE family transcriptional regulator [Algiphilus sp. NNCM1]|uniref:XRE family transcriptional regulator n=1 Tax=Algiphilus sp. TaxID=1872431 RepID=UPI001CA75C68|nr:XRE family transcriptional regulator [Algiphilus sp.]MBY8965962.1 XRE family transcriptional regulator [Algiphilus acroporae]MCI5062390.1 XRE family transcriptional regulator [Algiphilus sp.]MCI5102316.1 XRE family transcriptional regulator [Algiphilus sp.]